MALHLAHGVPQGWDRGMSALWQANARLAREVWQT
jgi:hypothetical protein